MIDIRRTRSIGKRGMSNIGTLMVQIAIILLVVSVVTMYIQYAKPLEEKGVARQNKLHELSESGIVVKDVTAFNTDQNTTDHEGLIITVDQVAGSEPIKLEDSQIYIQVGNRTAKLNIISGALVNNKSEGFYTE